ncbi:MAG TPA: hypothetical protein VK687_08380 [Bryobacteraceae bacterium]|nr:hypothetical protein [Bryobacteraceae bacterium]
MPRAVRLLGSLLLIAQAGFATIIMAVGTRDGLLVCEDRRLTIKTSNGQVSYADANKAQQTGKFGFFAVAGDVSGAVYNAIGQSITTFDILAEIPSFFKAHDIQQFDEPTALEFEAHLRNQLNQKPGNVNQRAPGPRAQTEVWLYWTDRAGVTRLYIVDITDGLREAAVTAAAPRLIGHFISLASFKTSKPLVRGMGLLGYKAIVAGKDPSQDDLRQDNELKPFLTDFVDADSIDSIAATRSIKKLIRQISERQNLLNDGGLDVGPASDCFLGTLDGIKNINQ